MKKILVLNANPVKGSLGEAIAAAYTQAALESGHEVRQVNVGDLGFDPSLKGGYHRETPVEDDLKAQQALLLWCEHLVIVTPNWWSGVPAVFKGYIDRVMLPHFAFAYRSSGLVDGLLKGRSARVIITQDSPGFWSRWVVGDPLWKMLKRGVLGFCGFAPVKRTVYASVRTACAGKRSGWLSQAAALGARGA